ncbi:MAG TPA: OmpH family outer membrane protein [Anaeromyxobacteraceae bacterium]|nr:OmpH family outer membrane protein [Anaeromyxobacteraceae bacterium]
MKTRSRLAAALAAALALAPAARADVKLGFVDIKRAMNEVDEGKAAKAQLKKDFDEKQKVIDEKQEELKRLKADLDKQAVLMSDQAKQAKQAELDRKVMETQQLFMQLQKDLSEREQKATGGIVEKMGVIIREIAAAEGLTMVFEKDGSGLLYADLTLDLTNELIRKYNARHGGTAAKKPDAAPAKPAPAAAKK